MSQKLFGERVPVATALAAGFQRLTKENLSQAAGATEFLLSYQEDRGVLFYCRFFTNSQWTDVTGETTPTDWQSLSNPPTRSGSSYLYLVSQNGGARIEIKINGGATIYSCYIRSIYFK